MKKKSNPPCPDFRPPCPPPPPPLGHMIDGKPSRYAPQRGISGRHAPNEWKRRSDARIKAQVDELLTRLLDEAFSVLEHDTSPDEVSHAHSRRVLRKRFARVLKIKEFTP